MSLNQISASVIQSTVKRLLSLDVEAKEQLCQFDDKIIHIQVEDFSLVYYFSFNNSEIVVSEQTEGEISASISGTSSAFIAAAAAEHSADSIFTGELKFSGEISTAKRFQSFAQSLNIDWHEPLAQLLGDPVAHTIATGIEKLSSWIKNTANRVTSDISEYVQEEARVTPSVSEQQHFFQQVDHIRSRTDRLNAKITKLSATMVPSQTNTRANNKNTHL